MDPANQSVDIFRRGHVNDGSETEVAEPPEPLVSKTYRNCEHKCSGKVRDRVRESCHHNHDDH